jgi:outer membrane protein assembly factor BamB
MVLARDVATGARLWNTDLGREITSPASVAGDTVLVGTNSGEVLGLDADGGTVKWEFYVGDGSIFDAPVTVGDTIYVVSQGGNLYALSE